MTKLVQALLLLSVCCVAPIAVAVEVEGLYEAEIPVTGQDATQRTEAMKAAMAQVLVKVSGDRTIGERAGIPELIQNAPQYVQQYIYRNAPPVPGARTPQAAGRVLWVRFDRDVLNRLLRQANIGVWGKARPALVLWLDLFEAGQHVVLGSSTRPEWKQFIDEIAKSRGVALSLPVMDAQDSAAMMSADIWSGTYEDVKSASARYPSEAIIVGRIESLSGMFRGDWTLYEHDGQRSWSAPAESRDGAVLDGLQAAIDAVAERYTSSGQGGDSLMHVIDVRSLEDYARITKYLSSLAAVERVQLLRIEGNSMLFRVDAQGGVQRLADDIRLGKTLVAEPIELANGNAQDAAVRYRLLR
jgi:hypothetical protein